MSSYKFDKHDANAFSKAMIRRGYSASNAESAKRIINGFIIDYKNDLTEKNITVYDFEMASVYRSTNPALIMTMFRDWLNTKDDSVIWGARKRGGKDGLSRPNTCKKMDCAFNSSSRCRYKPLKELNHLLTWSACSYYEKVERKDELEPKTKSRTVSQYDYIFNRKASYKDASSARWI